MSDDALITWDPPPSHLHNGIIREYFVEVTGDGENETAIHKTGSVSLLITDLHPDASYYVRVAGHTVGVGPYSSPVHLHTLEDGRLYSSLNTVEQEGRHFVKILMNKPNNRKFTPTKIFLLCYGKGHNTMSELIQLLPCPIYFNLSSGVLSLE